MCIVMWIGFRGTAAGPLGANALAGSLSEYTACPAGKTLQYVNNVALIVHLGRSTCSPPACAHVTSAMHNRQLPAQTCAVNARVHGQPQPFALSLNFHGWGSYLQAVHHLPFMSSFNLRTWRTHVDGMPMRATHAFARWLVNPIFAWRCPYLRIL